MRRTDINPAARRLTGVGTSTRKSMAASRKSVAGTDNRSSLNVRYSLMGRNSICPSTAKTGKRIQTAKDPRDLQGNKA